jgi:hypothetical protein
MEKGYLRLKMDEFLQKVGDIAPTLLLVEMEHGTECGGVAGVPWPKGTGAKDPSKVSLVFSLGATSPWPAPYAAAKDPSKVSCIFSLGATPTRFGLVSADDQAIRSWWNAFGFGGRSGGAELAVGSDGWGCIARGQKCYAGPPGVGSLIGTSPSSYGRYARWELWRL